MNKRETKRAAKIYALANTYHSLLGSDPEDDTTAAVRDAAVEWAMGELDKMGLQPCDLLSIDDCIAAATS